MSQSSIARGGGGGMAETKLRALLMRSATANGVWARSVNDQFNSGYPDLRMKHPDYPHIDVELKVCRVSYSTASSIDAHINTGIRPLQAIELRDMNKAGIPAVGMIYVEVLDTFYPSIKGDFAPQELYSQDLMSIAVKGKPRWSFFMKAAFRYLKKEGYDYGV